MINIITVSNIHFRRNNIAASEALISINKSQSVNNYDKFDLSFLNNAHLLSFKALRRHNDHYCRKNYKELREDRANSVKEIINNPEGNIQKIIKGNNDPKVIRGAVDDCKSVAGSLMCYIWKDSNLNNPCLSVLVSDLPGIIARIPEEESRKALQDHVIKLLTKKENDFAIDLMKKAFQNQENRV